MEGEFIIRKKRIFFCIEAVHENFITMKRFAGRGTKETDKQENDQKLFFKIHKLILSSFPF